MRIAFIGGTRFIGRAAVETALAVGHEVFTIHRGQHPAPASNAVDVIADRADPEALRGALTDIGPDAVVDTWAMTGAGAAALVTAVAGVCPHLVVLSSQDVYAQFGRLNGLPAPAPEQEITERSPLTIPTPFRHIAEHPGGPDYDKKDVERIVREATGGRFESSVCLRLPAVYGSNDPQRRFGAIVDRLDAGLPLPCRDGASFRWTHAHVQDVAAAILAAAVDARPGATVYNVGERSTPTMRARAEALAKAMGVPLVWEPVDTELPADLAMLGPMPNDLVVSSRAIRDDLGATEVTSEAERLDDTIAWLRASRP